jgi:cytochrome c556
MKWLAVGGVAAVIVAGFLIGSGTSEEPNKVRDFMRVKLSYSQKVLEGLTTEDFDLIAKNSQAMSLLSQATNWQVLQTAEYLQQSQDFRHTADALTEAARKKNLDGAALAYVELTMKCINCHKYVRGVRTAR